MATFDVPGAFLQLDRSKRRNNERFMLKIVGEFVNIMCDVTPERKKYCLQKRKEGTVYGHSKDVVWMHRAFTKMVRAIFKKIEERRFFINP